MCGTVCLLLSCLLLWSPQADKNTGSFRVFFFLSLDHHRQTETPAPFESSSSSSLITTGRQKHQLLSQRLSPSFLSHRKTKCMFVMISARPAGWLSVCGKNFTIAIFSDTINMINVKLCLLVYSLSFTHSYHFQWPWFYFEVTAVLTENFTFLSDEIETFYDCWLCQVDLKHTKIFDCRTFPREIIDILPCFINR